ncbi:MAG: hypothetical protein PHO94_06785 [Petrimonas sp.]|nr:hypothetical protein [Petrimonas sp.]
MKKMIFLFAFFVFTAYVSAQFTKNYKLSAGIVSQKTQKLYWENGVGADYTSDFLLQKRIHLKAAFVTSRLGSAMGSNAIKQETFVVGADWRFRPTRPFQIFTGLNTGFFKANYEDPMFDMLPNSSVLAQFEGGVAYHFNWPVSLFASFGYNFLSGNGKQGPGTLFPVFYQLKAYYTIK